MTPQERKVMELANALNELLESFEKDGRFCKSSSIRNELYDRLKQTLEESKEALAQPEQEPLGVMVSMDVSKGDEPEYRIFGRIYEVQRDGEGEDEVTYLAIEDSRNFDTTQPQRKPLTDEEFTTAIEVEGIPVEDVELVYAIKDLVEAAHGIKE